MSAENYSTKRQHSGYEFCTTCLFCCFNRAVHMPSVPLTVSCFSKIQVVLTFLVPADLYSPGKGPLNACLCVCVRACVRACVCVPVDNFTQNRTVGESPTLYPFSF